MTSTQSPYFSPFTNYAFKAEPGETMNSIFSHSPYFAAGGATSSSQSMPSVAAAAAAQFMHPWFNQYSANGLNPHQQ